MLTASWMELLKQQLEATNVFFVNIQSEEWKVYRSTLGENTYPVRIMRWGMDYFDPSNFLEPFVFSGGYGTNVTRAAESTIYPPSYEPINSMTQQLADLLTQAGAEPDPVLRSDLYGDAQDLYADLVVTIPLFYLPKHILYRSNIHGSSEYDFTETLNIGNSLEFNYSTVSKTP